MLEQLRIVGLADMLDAAFERQDEVAILNLPQRQTRKIPAGVAVVRNGSIIDGEDGHLIPADDKHRQRVVLEQQPDRCFALLHLGDVDAQADEAALARPAFLDQIATPVVEKLLVWKGRCAIRFDLARINANIQFSRRNRNAESRTS
jgi:hypothetical protein